MRVKKLILSALLALLFFFAVQRWRTFQRNRDEFRRDKLRDVAFTLAGANTTDCGRVAKGSSSDGEYDVAQSQETVDGCAVAAFKARKPFVARFDMDTKPSYQAFVGTGQGQLYVISTNQPNIISTMQRSLIAKPQIVRLNGHDQLR